MSEVINIQNTVESWAEITVREFQAKLNALNVGVTGALYESLQHQVIGSEENIERVRFTYNSYGIFVNFGVGREISQGNTGDVGREVRRQRKPWFSPVIFRESHILSRLMAERYGMKAAAIIIETIKK